MTLSLRLRQARKAKNWTQHQLEKASGVKQGTISQIERGDQKRSVYVGELAKALQVSADWLSEGTLPMHNNIPPNETTGVKELPAHYDIDTKLAKECADLTAEEVAMATVFIQGLKAGR